MPVPRCSSSSPQRTLWPLLPPPPAKPKVHVEGTWAPRGALKGNHPTHTLKSVSTHFLHRNTLTSKTVVRSEKDWEMRIDIWETGDVGLQGPKRTW